MQLQAKKREIIGKKVSQLRNQNKIPAVLYGHGIKNINLEIDRHAFDKIYREAGESTLIDLSVDGAEAVKVLIAEIQTDIIKDLINHVDLLQIRMDEKITARVQLEFIGESEAVKDFGGVLVHGLNEFEIKCLPADLIHKIEIDISKLDKIGDTVLLSDLDIPESVEIVGHEDDEVVASIIEPKIEEEPEVPAENEEDEEGEEGEVKEGEESEVKEGEESENEKAGEQEPADVKTQK